MSTDVQIADLLKPMLKKRLFVALSKAVTPAEQMLTSILECRAANSCLSAAGLLA